MYAHYDIPDPWKFQASLLYQTKAENTEKQTFCLREAR